MQVEIKDSLIERLEKVMEVGVQRGYHGLVPFEVELNAILEKEIGRVEEELGI